MSTESKTTADASGAAPAAPAAPPAATPGATTPQAASTAPAATPSVAPPAPPAPNKAPPPVAPPAKGDPDAIKLAANKLLEAEAAVTEVATYIEASQKELATRQAVRDAAQAVLDKLQPLQTNGELIQAYLASQRETLRLRGEQIARVTAFQKENGFKLADLMPKRAPLDSAMARKTQRGTQRPGSK